MREAPALAGISGNRPRSNPTRRPKSSAPNGRPGSLVGRAFARPGVTIAGAAFAALMTGIVANAVLFQKGHRPAPLFGSAQPIAPPTKIAPARIEPAPSPQPSAAVAPDITDTATISSAPVRAAAVPRPTVPAPAKAKLAALPPRVDPIQRLLGAVANKSQAAKSPGITASHALPPHAKFMVGQPAQQQQAKRRNSDGEHQIDR